MSTLEFKDAENPEAPVCKKRKFGLETPMNPTPVMVFHTPTKKIEPTEPLQPAPATTYNPNPILKPNSNLSGSRKMEENIKLILEGQTKFDQKMENLRNDVNTGNSAIEKKVDERFDGINETLAEMQKVQADFVKRVEILEKDVQAVKEAHSKINEELTKVANQFRSMKDAQLRSMEHTFDNYLILKGIPEQQNESAVDLKHQVDQMIANTTGVSTPCTSATRIGKNMNGTRPARVYWVDKTNRNIVLRNSKKFLPIKISKDLPMPVRVVQQKIRAKGWELRQKGVEFTYNDLGLTIDGKFFHHEDLQLENKEEETMDQ